MAEAAAQGSEAAPPAKMHVTRLTYTPAMENSLLDQVLALKPFKGSCAGGVGNAWKEICSNLASTYTDAGFKSHTGVAQHFKHMIDAFMTVDRAQGAPGINRFQIFMQGRKQTEYEDYMTKMREVVDLLMRSGDAEESKADTASSDTRADAVSSRFVVTYSFRVL